MKKENKSIHIGTLIKRELKKSGMSKSEFARQLETTPQNIYGIFKRDTIDTGTLLLISKILRFDFFMVYEMEYAKSVMEEIKMLRKKKITYTFTNGRKTISAK